MSQVAIVLAVAPAAGPIVGGWLQVWLGWRSVFAFLTVFSAVLWYSTWRTLPETLDPAHRQRIHPGALLAGYWQALSSARFPALVLALTLNFATAFWAYRLRQSSVSPVAAWRGVSPAVAPPAGSAGRTGRRARQARPRG